MIKKFRSMAKPLIIIICIAFVGGALYIGGASFFGGGQPTYPTVATVNGKIIDEYEFQNAYYQELQYYQSIYGQLNSQMLEGIRYNAFDLLVSNALIMQELETRNIEVDSDEVDAEIAAFKEMYDKEVLEQAGYTDDYIEEMVTLRLKYDKLIEEVSGNIEVSEQEIIDMYEEVWASHILIRVESDDEQEWDEAKEQAQLVLSELEVLDFAEAAKMYSEDGSADDGGDLGYIKRGDTVAEFEEAVFSMEPGEISDLVKSDFGYHIIKVHEVKQAGDQEYLNAKEDLHLQIVSEKQADIFSQWLKEQRNQAEIVISDSQLIAYEHVMSGELEAAVTAYQMAIEENPDNGFLYASLGEVYSQLDKPEEMLTAYEQAVEKQPNDGQLALTLGSLYQETGDIDKAVEVYLTASELMPYDLYTQYVLRAVLSDLEQDEAATVVEERIAEIEELYAQAQSEADEDLDIDPDLNEDIDIDSLLDEEGIPEIEEITDAIDQ